MTQFQIKYFLAAFIAASIRLTGNQKLSVEVNKPTRKSLA